LTPAPHPRNVRPLRFGAIAQLGERNTGSVEVGGSIPPSSTKSFDKYPDAGVAGVLPVSIENLEFLTHSGS
jgi:hypothetical protein